MGRDHLSYLVCESRKIFPKLLSQLPAQARLNFAPDRQYARELLVSAFGQPQQPFPVVFAAAFGNPALPDHDFQIPRQGGAVHRKDFSQFSLRYVTGPGEHLQDCELSHPYAQRPEFVLVELGQRPRHPAKSGAEARKCWHGRDGYGCDSFSHNQLDAYTYFKLQIFWGTDGDQLCLFREKAGPTAGLRPLNRPIFYLRAGVAVNQLPIRKIA